MANQNQLFDLPPLTKEDLSYPQFAMIVPDDVLQLQADCANVQEGRVELNSFDSEYQIKIKNYYRFSARWQNSKSHNRAQRSADTLELI